MRRCASSVFFCWIAAAALLNPCSIVRAREPSAKGDPIQVSFDLLVVDLSQAAALPLIPELRDRKRSGKATERLLKMIAEKKATLTAWPTVTTKSDSRAMVEQVDEFIYASSFDAPGHAIVTEQHPDTTGSSEAANASDNPKSVGPTVATKGRVTTTDATYEGVPKHFQTKNVGVTLEIEPALPGDAATIEVSISTRHVRFLGMKRIEIEQKGSAKTTVVEQPQFSANTINTALTVHDGEHTLLGVFKLDESPDRIELFILRSQVERTVLFNRAE